jgi:hypothetical protein
MGKTKIFLLNDHKTGFNLTKKTINIINKIYCCNINIQTFYLFWNNNIENNKYIVLIRDPKEIIISGYLYHKKCNEKWAITKNGYYYDYWVENHFTKESIKENENYLRYPKNFSNPLPYQDKLKSLPQTKGIIKEMNSVAYLTIMGLYNLKHIGTKNTYILKYEDLVFDHDKTIESLCSFLNINYDKTQQIIKESVKNNLVYIKNHGKSLNHSTNIDVKFNRYLEFWNDEIQKEFDKLFPIDLMQKLGYE